MKVSVGTAAGWLDNDGTAVKTVTQTNNYWTRIAVHHIQYTVWPGSLVEEKLTDQITT